MASAEIRQEREDKAIHQSYSTSDAKIASLYILLWWEFFYANRRAKIWKLVSHSIFSCFFFILLIFLLSHVKAVLYGVSFPYTEHIHISLQLQQQHLMFLYGRNSIESQFPLNLNSSFSLLYFAGSIFLFVCVHNFRMPRIPRRFHCLQMNHVALSAIPTSNWSEVFFSPAYRMKHVHILEILQVHFTCRKTTDQKLSILGDWRNITHIFCVCRSKSERKLWVLMLFGAYKFYPWHSK